MILFYLFAYIDIDVIHRLVHQALPMEGAHVCYLICLEFVQYAVKSLSIELSI